MIRYGLELAHLPALSMPDGDFLAHIGRPYSLTPLLVFCLFLPPSVFESLSHSFLSF